MLKEDRRQFQCEKMCLNSRSKWSPAYKSQVWPWIRSGTACVLMKAQGVKMGLASCELNLTLVSSSMWTPLYVNVFSLSACKIPSSEFLMILTRTLTRLETCSLTQKEVFQKFLTLLCSTRQFSMSYFSLPTTLHFSKFPGRLAYSLKNITDFYQSFLSFGVYQRSKMKWLSGNK